MKASSLWTLYGIISLAKIRRMYSQLLIRYKPQNIQIYSKNSNLTRNKSFQIYVSIHRQFPFRSFSFSALWSFHWYFYWSQSSNCFVSATDCRLSIRVSFSINCDCQLLVSCAHTFRWKQRTHRRVKARMYVVTGTVACVCSLHTSENISLAPFKKEKSGKGNEGKESQSIVRVTSLTQHLAQRCSPSMANKGRAV